MIITFLVLIFLVLLFGAAAMRSALASLLAMVVFVVLVALLLDWGKQFSGLQLLAMFAGFCIAVYVCTLLFIAANREEFGLAGSANAEHLPSDPQVIKMAEARRALDHAKTFLDDQMNEEAEAAYSRGNYLEIWAILKKARQGQPERNLRLGEQLK